MVISSTPNATRAVRPLLVVEHLEHAASTPVGSRHAPREPAAGPQFSRSFAADLDTATGNGIDPELLARAVEDLLRVIAPTVRARVQVELIRPTAGSSGATAGGAAGSALGLSPVPTVPTDGLLIDLGSRTLSVDGAPVSLTRREFDLLAYLERRHGVALSRRELMTAVWRTGYLDGDRTVDVHVRRIRMKLGRHAHRLSTLRGYGYRLD